METKIKDFINANELQFEYKDVKNPQTICDIIDGTLKDTYNDPIELFMVGHHYECVEDYKNAGKFYKLAIDKGNIDAMISMAYIKNKFQYYEYESKQITNIISDNKLFTMLTNIKNKNDYVNSAIDIFKKYMKYENTVKQKKYMTYANFFMWGAAAGVWFAWWRFKV